MMFNKICEKIREIIQAYLFYRIFEKTDSINFEPEKKK